MQIRIQLFNSIRIRIQGATTMRINADPDTRRLHRHKKVRNGLENLLYEDNVVYQVYFVYKVKFPCPWNQDPHSQYGSGSRRAKALQIYADPNNCFRVLTTGGRVSPPPLFPLSKVRRVEII
jgi:hypothetical protein